MSASTIPDDLRSVLEDFALMDKDTQREFLHFMRLMVRANGDKAICDILGRADQQGISLRDKSRLLEAYLRRRTN